MVEETMVQEAVEEVGVMEGEADTELLPICQELEVERALGTLDATHKVPRNPGLPREEH